MIKLKVFSEIEQTINNIPEAKSWQLPINPSLLQDPSSIRYIQTVDEAKRLIVELNRTTISAIAIDTEFGFTSPAVELRANKPWYDIHSLSPMLLSGAVWQDGSNHIITFVIDLRVREVIPWVEKLLQISAVFVGHNLKAEFQTLWTLGLEPVLHRTHDTWVAAKLLTLGRGHEKVEILQLAKDDGDIGAIERANAQVVGLMSLVGQCEVYGIGHRYAGAKDIVANSFLAHPAEQPFSQLQIEYSAADAEATLLLYQHQQTDIIAKGLQSQLSTVEFPFVEANAWMEWNGVLVDEARLTDLSKGLAKSVKHHRRQLAQTGLENPNSPAQVIKWLKRRGLGDKVIRNGKPTSNGDVLKTLIGLEPLTEDIRRFRKYSQLLSNKLLSNELVGADGRAHSSYNHLAAASTRSSSSSPNIPGITKTFRPVVVAPPGRALIELDYAQIEVGICAAYYRDQRLIDAFNSGDVYASVAQQFYHDGLTEHERTCSPEEFKKLKPDQRNRIKTFVLAVLYNMQPQSIADQFGVSLAEATQQRTDFLDSYPALRDAMKAEVKYGRIKGYAKMVGGIRRHINRSYKSENQLINTPVQGSAAVVFRHAVVRLYKRFHGSTTKLVMPIHDAVLFECDAHDVTEVGQVASAIMIDAVREYFPELQPRVDINDADPTCWNKDGQSGSLDEFLEDPSFKLE